MKMLNEMTLTERVKLYADGDPGKGIPAHGFDFSHEDAEAIMSALRIAKNFEKAYPIKAVFRLESKKDEDLYLFDADGERRTDETERP